jgi:hypothetical protein
MKTIFLRTLMLLAAVTLFLVSACAQQSTNTPVATPPPEPTPPAAASAVESADQPPYFTVAPLPGEGWHPLFDGKSLAGWKVTEFAGHGDVSVTNGTLVLAMGAILTGVNLVKTNDLPTWDYELALDAMKVDGSDFFCGLTFPVGTNCCTFVVGGWGGGVTGISSIDNNDASINETTHFLDYPAKRWFRIRVRVTHTRLQAWIGAQKMADVELAGKHLGMRLGEIELNQPFGIATYETTGAIKNIQWRKIQ